MTFGDNYHHFSHIEPFAFKRPCALLPYCYGAGQQDSSGYSLQQSSTVEWNEEAMERRRGVPGVTNFALCASLCQVENSVR